MIIFYYFYFFAAQQKQSTQTMYFPPQDVSSPAKYTSLVIKLFTTVTDQPRLLRLLFQLPVQPNIPEP